jgi:uncharacterized protein with von Willebrand factor type A (vWA) domain
VTGLPRPAPGQLGGIVHAYQKYDPAHFPSPTAEPTEVLGAAMDHLLAYGDMRELTEEELARAVRLDPSIFPSLGPSIESLRRMLLERKAKILGTYRVDGARREAERALEAAGAPPEEGEPDGLGERGERGGRRGLDAKLRQQLARAVRQRQVYELERLYDRLGDDTSPAALAVMRAISALVSLVQVEQLNDAYSFTGRTELGAREAIEVKAELEKIDELLRQLDEAAKNAQVAVIDMDALSEFADPGQIEEFNKIGEMVRESVRRAAERAGLSRTREGYSLTPKGLRALQKLLLGEVFGELRESRTGRHSVGIVGQGPVELERTRGYEFGDEASGIDATQTLLNALAGGALPGAGTGAGGRTLADGPRLRVSSRDIAVRLTRNNPRCATSVVMDMSGSMRYDGQYVNVKRMALALDGLIRGEYPGDFLAFVEMYTVARLTGGAELVGLLPKPVSIHSPRVRLKADMADPATTPSRLPQHFTNIQHALRLSRQVLGAQATPNRQVLLITDGLPTAHFEGSDLLMLYPPDPLTERATLREALACAREGITINIFLLQSWNQTELDVRFAHTLAQSTKGRVFFVAGKQLDRFVVWDYVKNRRRIVG